MSVGMADYSKRKSGHRNYRSWNGWALRRNKHHHPLVSVITNIGLDTQFLVQLNCWRKAGITKLNVPVVIGEYTPETKAVLQLKPQKKAQQSIFC
jgi:dihydrofolate synthase/folylpolyglutamate synthase